MKKRPNILFIMTDEQRYDTVGYRNSDVITPNLNQLKRGAINFCNAYTTNPSCVPARAAIFTGKYPSQCGAPAYITPLESNETTFMTRLREAGYYTATIGKQHFADTEVEHGYDYENIVDNHGPNFSEKNGYTDFLKDAGFTESTEFMELDNTFSWRWKQDVKYHVDSYVGDCGTEWLEKNSKEIDKPWFLCVSFPGPHQPFNGIGLPTEELYEEDTLTLPKNIQSDLDQKPDYYWEQILTGKGNAGEMPVKDATQEQIRRARKAYYSVMTMIDEKIGNMIDSLKKSGEYEDTMIIYTADHGEYMGDFGMFGKGQYLSEALMRVPFLLKPPIKNFFGYDEEEFVLNFEVAPTCLEVAGSEIPSEMSARSLVKYCKGEVREDVLEYVYMEALDVRGIRSEEWKFVYYQSREYGELYHLLMDPDERINLWNDDEYKDIKMKHMAFMCDKMISLGRNSQSKWNYAAPII